jgi:hypothetical protein
MIHSERLKASGSLQCAVLALCLSQACTRGTERAAGESNPADVPTAPSGSSQRKPPSLKGASVICEDGVSLKWRKFRVLLPDRRALILVSFHNEWQIGRSQRLSQTEYAGVLKVLDAEFFQLPEDLSNREVRDGGYREIQVASESGGHRVHNYALPSPDFERRFSACAEAFGSVEVRRTDPAGARVVIDEVRQFAMTLPEADARRSMLAEWAAQWAEVREVSPP